MQLLVRRGIVWRLYGFPRNRAFQWVLLPITMALHLIFDLSFLLFSLPIVGQGRTLLFPSLTPTLGKCFPFSMTVVSLSVRFAFLSILNSFNTTWDNLSALLVFLALCFFSNLGILCLKYLLHAVHVSSCQDETL